MIYSWYLLSGVFFYLNISPLDLPDSDEEQEEFEPVRDRQTSTSEQPMEHSDIDSNVLSNTAEEKEEDNLKDKQSLSK